MCETNKKQNNNMIMGKFYKFYWYGKGCKIFKYTLFFLKKKAKCFSNY